MKFAFKETSLFQQKSCLTPENGPRLPHALRPWGGCSPSQLIGQLCRAPGQVCSPVYPFCICQTEDPTSTCLRRLFGGLCRNFLFCLTFLVVQPSPTNRGAPLRAPVRSPFSFLLCTSVCLRSLPLSCSLYRSMSRALVFIIKSFKLNITLQRPTVSHNLPLFL